MKQITLRSESGAGADTGEPCLARLALTWAAYGYLVALLWRALGVGPMGDAGAWAIALLGGFALAAWTMGV